MKNMPTIIAVLPSSIYAPSSVLCLYSTSQHEQEPVDTREIAGDRIYFSGLGITPLRMKTIMVSV
jgi:hypothetical protein